MNEQCMAKATWKRNTKGLKPFKPGDKRINREGAPKLPKLSDIMSRVLGKENKGKTEAEAIIEKWKAMAKAGNIRAGELLIERGFGKVTQTIDVSDNRKAAGELFPPTNDK